MNSFNPNRRRLLGVLPAMGLGGVGGASLLSQFMSEANAQSSGDYKALVCVRLDGANDSFNTVLATDSDSWSRYQSARNTGSDQIALLGPGATAVMAGGMSPLNGRTVSSSTPEFFGGVLPIVPATAQTVPGSSSTAARTFAVHPLLGSVQSLFQAGRLAVVANVGPMLEPTSKAAYLDGTVNLPRNLFSHYDQSIIWEAGESVGSIIGWGGQFADSVMAMNGSNAVFTGVSTRGATSFLSARSAAQYQIDPSAGAVIIATGNEYADMSATMLSVASAEDANYLASSYAAIVRRSISAGGAVNTALASGGAAAVAAPTQMTDPIKGSPVDNPLAIQMQMVARMIAAGQSMGMKRQLFVVTIGSFDFHSLLNTGHPPLLASIDHAFNYFDQTLSTLNGADMRSKVTTFTASEFGRGFTSNGDGCDHGWGGHHFVMGGSVRGGNIYGKFPTLGVDSGSFTNPDTIPNGVLIPTTSVDQYGATLGAWFGIDSTTIHTIFPNLARFSSSNLGFV